LEGLIFLHIEGIDEEGIFGAVSPVAPPVNDLKVKIKN
jgi:hypothetical protein